MVPERLPREKKTSCRGSISKPFCLQHVLWGHVAFRSFERKRRGATPSSPLCMGKLAEALDAGSSYHSSLPPNTLPLPGVLRPGLMRGTLQQAARTVAGRSRVFRKTCSRIAQPTFRFARFRAQAGNQGCKYSKGAAPSPCPQNPRWIFHKKNIRGSHKTPQPMVSEDATPCQELLIPSLPHRDHCSTAY